MYNLYKQCHILCISLDKMANAVTIFLYLHENLCCGYSLEAPQQGASNDSHTIDYGIYHSKISKIST